MKKEELERLEAKFLAGETSLSEEKLLKEQSDHAVHIALKKKDAVEMNLSFDDFITQVASSETRIQPIRKSYWWKVASTVAAALFVAAVGLVYYAQGPVLQMDRPVVKQTDMRTAQMPSVIAPVQEIAEPKRLPKKSTVTLQKKATRKIESLGEEQLPIEESAFYVEVNGVKITNQEQAMDITSNALQLASSSLVKTAQVVENLEYLIITL